MTLHMVSRDLDWIWTKNILSSYWGKRVAKDLFYEISANAPEELNR